MNPHTGTVVNADLSAKPPLDWPYCHTQRTVDSTTVTGERTSHHGTIMEQITVIQTQVSISRVLPFDVTRQTIPGCSTELHTTHGGSTNPHIRLAKTQENCAVSLSPKERLAPPKQLARSSSQTERRGKGRRVLEVLRGRASSDSGPLMGIAKYTNKFASGSGTRSSHEKPVASWDSAKDSMVASTMAVPSILLLRPPEDVSPRAESVTSEQAKALELGTENDDALGCRLQNLRLDEPDTDNEADAMSVTLSNCGPEMDIDDRPCEAFSVPENERREEEYFSDDPYWEWDVGKQQFKHLDSDTEEWVYCPAEFD